MCFYSSTFDRLRTLPRSEASTILTLAFRPFIELIAKEGAGAPKALPEIIALKTYGICLYDYWNYVLNF